MVSRVLQCALPDVESSRGRRCAMPGGLQARAERLWGAQHGTQQLAAGNSDHRPYALAIQ